MSPSNSKTLIFILGGAAEREERLRSATGCPDGRTGPLRRHGDCGR